MKKKQAEQGGESIAEDLLKADEEAPQRGRKYVKKHSKPEPEKKKAPAPRADTRAGLSKLTTDGDLVDIWERRILNPNHQETMPIRIKTPGMHLRWINLQNRGRFQRARYEQGYVPVHKSELTDEREIYGANYTSEGYVCRGEKQSEMLMKIPAAVYKQIQKKRAELNRKSYDKLREQMGSAGHQHFKDKYGGSAGDMAAEAASNFVGSVKFGTEKASSDDLFE
jgi:hypothetical protein